MRSADIITRLRGLLAESLIAVDFDGTLAPIVQDPGAARPAPGAIEALVGLAAAGARVAVITGRGAETVVQLGGLAAVPRLVVAGVHGAESWRDGRLTTVATPDAIEQLRAGLPALLAACDADPAVWVEDKRLSLVVHARRAADPAAERDRLRGPVGALASQLGLEVHDGRDVLEIRLPGIDKGNVLQQLVAEIGATAVLFAGDDVGDLPAFDAIRKLRAAGLSAWGVAAASAEAPQLRAAADVCVDGPSGVVAFLTALLGSGGDFAGHPPGDVPPNPV